MNGVLISHISNEKICVSQDLLFFVMFPLVTVLIIVLKLNVSFPNIYYKTVFIFVSTSAPLCAVLYSYIIELLIVAI